MFCEALGIKIVSLFIRIDIRISQTPLLICPQQSRLPSRVKYPCYVYVVITFDQQIFHSFFVCVILIPRDINNTSKAFCFASLPWRHNGRDGVSNHQPRHYLFNRLFRRRSKKTSKLRVTGLCAGNSPVTGEFPAQIASNGNFFPFDDVIMMKSDSKFHDCFGIPYHNMPTIVTMRLFAFV